MRFSTNTKSLAKVQDTTCPHVTMFRMKRGASSSPEHRDMVISTIAKEVSEINIFEYCAHLKIVFDVFLTLISNHPA